MLVVVGSCRPYYWSCGASGHESVPGKNVTPQPQPTTAETAEAESGKAPGGVWKEVVKKGRKSISYLLFEGGRRKRAGRSRAERDMSRVRSQSVPASPAKIKDIAPKSRIVPTLLTRSPSPPFIYTPTCPLSRLIQPWEKKHFSNAEEICKVDRRKTDENFHSEVGPLGSPI